MVLPVRRRDLEILGKIELARDLYLKFKQALESQPQIVKLFCDLEQLLCRSRNIMAEMGINDLCRTCDEEEGGSCCGAGIENRYDSILLLLNLMVGVNLPTSRFNDNSCFFLGPEGCRLRIRHTICVNFLCNKIEDNLSLNQLVRLQTVLGEEMEKTFLLYEAAKKSLRMQTEL